MKKLSNPTVFRINSLQVTFQRAAGVDLPANHFLMAFKLWNGNFPTFIALDFWILYKSSIRPIEFGSIPF